MKTFEDVVDFHGHMCPGLALGYKVSMFALKELGERASDEELVAIVENNSCAVDAVQVITGCTFGKGNLIFKDYGKHIYTFIKRPSRNRVAATGNSIRISVEWKSPEETEEEKHMWDRYMKGDHSEKILRTVHNRRAKKINTILNAKDEELFKVTKGKIDLPKKAKIYPSIICALCGEKVMEPRARIENGKIVCIPCFEGDGQ
jgi:formylmethanofuran dehydrogenase subunit E